MTLIHRNNQSNQSLTRLSDHFSGPSFIEGFGTTITSVVQLCDGDWVKVLSADTVIVGGISGICALISGPLAVVTFPVAVLAGLGAIANDLAVCQQWEGFISQPEQSADFWQELPDTEPINSCELCQHFQSKRDRSQPDAGVCVRWGDPTWATDFCDDFQQFTITIPHRTILPEPIQSPAQNPEPIALPPQPIAPAAAKPTLIQRKDIGANPDEELKIWNSKPVEESLSEQAAYFDRNLQSIATDTPQGFTNSLQQFMEIIEESDLGWDEKTVTTTLKELVRKRPNKYAIAQDVPFLFTTRGVA